MWWCWRAAIASKIGKIKASLEAGLNVLVGQALDYPRRGFYRAGSWPFPWPDQKGLVAYDMMTERHEITTILQRELVNDPDVFGTLIPADLVTRAFSWKAPITF